MMRCLPFNAVVALKLEFKNKIKPIINVYTFLFKCSRLLQNFKIANK